jgi:hypothetical protein
VPAEVLRRADDYHSHVGRYPDGHHVVVQPFSKANARVKPLRDDVGDRVVDADLERDVRIVRQKAFDSGPQEARGRVLAAVYPHGACRLVPQFGKS